MSIISKKRIDILRYGFYFLNNDSKIKNTFDTVVNRVINKDEYNELIFKNLLLTEDFSCIWNIIFKKEILGELRFDNNVKYGEDLLFSYELLLKSSNMIILEEPLYNYENNNSGASKFISLEKCLNRLNNEIYVDEYICKLFSKYVELGENAKYRINNCFRYNLKYITKEGYRKYKEYIREVIKIDTKYIDKNIIYKKDNFLSYLVYRTLQFLKSLKGRG